MVVGGGGGGGGGGAPTGPVRVIDNQGPKVANTSGPITPIVADIKGKFRTIEAKVTSITPKKDNVSMALNAGKNHGVAAGAVGDIYVDGKILEGGRFRVDKIGDSSCIATTNAPEAEVKRASKIVIKVPE